MDTPVTETAPEATPTNLDALPDASGETSFESSLETAFASLEAGPDYSEYESSPEPASEPEPESEPASELEPESRIEDQDSGIGQDSLESLTEDIGDDWTPKAASRFKELKTELKTNRSDLDALRQQTKEYESKIQELTGLAESNDVEQMQAKLAEYETQQAMTNLEQTSAYQQAVTDPLAALVEQSDQIADKYDVDSDALIDVLSLNDPQEQEDQLSELMPHASDRDKAKIFRIMEDIDPILKRRESLFENADSALAEAKLLEEQNANAVAAENAATRQNITRNVVERVQQKLPFLKGIEGLDMAAIEQKASGIDPSVMHPVDHAYNAVSAQVFPTVIRKYLETRKEVELLTDRLAEYESAEPTMSGTTNSAASTMGSDATFEQRVNAALGSM